MITINVYIRPVYNSFYEESKYHCSQQQQQQLQLVTPISTYNYLFILIIIFSMKFYAVN